MQSLTTDYERIIREDISSLMLNQDLVRSINDPEHPLTLEELNVVEESLVKVDDDNNVVHINFTPTIPHCSMATLIGLAIRVKLLRSLPERFKVDVEITPGSHASEHAGTIFLSHNVTGFMIKLISRSL